MLNERLYRSSGWHIYLGNLLISAVLEWNCSASSRFASWASIRRYQMSVRVGVSALQAGKTGVE